MSRAVMQMALEAMQAMQAYAEEERKGLRICDEAITALREALAQPEQEPLSQYRIDRIVGRLQVQWPDYFDLDVATQLVRAIEAAHGIKENK